MGIAEGPRIAGVVPLDRPKPARASLCVKHVQWAIARDSNTLEAIKEVPSLLSKPHLLDEPAKTAQMAPTAYSSPPPSLESKWSHLAGRPVPVLLPKPNAL